MGNNSTNFKKRDLDSNKQQVKKNEEKSPEMYSYSPEPFFSSKDRLILLESWKELEEHMKDIGLRAFQEFFKKDEISMSKYPFMKIMSTTEYEKLPDISDHVIRVTGLLTILIKQIQSNETIPYSMKEMLFDLGEKHFSYGASPETVEILGLLFSQSFSEPFLGQPQYQEKKEAWRAFFEVVVYWINAGYRFVCYKGTVNNLDFNFVVSQ